MKASELIQALNNVSADAREILTKIKDIATQDNNVIITFYDGTTVTVPSLEKLRQQLDSFINSISSKPSQTPAPNAIPISDNNGFLNSWINQGPGSGLDADKVDGFDTSSSAAPNKIPVSDNNGFLNTWIKQGKGSGLDADLVRGLPADFTSSLADSGYQKLPSGLIIQWGMSMLPGTSWKSGASITFPIAFTTKCLSVVATPIRVDNTLYTTAFQIKAATVTEFIVWESIGLEAEDNMSSLRIFWTAIGY